MKILFIIATLSLTSCGSVQTNENSAIAVMIKNQEFVFIAQTAIPSRTAPIAVSGGGYELRLLQDSLSLILPFYGRANNISVVNTGGPLELRTKNFRYSVSKKKSRWEAYIHPTGQTSIRQINLSVSENGFASLQVMSNDRDNMTYNGVVEALKK